MITRRKAPAPQTPAVIICSNLDYPVRYAAWFGRKQAAKASSLATPAGFHVLPVDSEEAKTLARALEEGAIRSGELSLALVTDALAADVNALLFPHRDVSDDIGSTDGLEPSADESASHDAADAPSSEIGTAPTWYELQPGSLVLAADLDRQGQPECWYEAIIVRAEGSEFTLRWRDFPREGLLTRTRRHIAILHPSL